MQKPSLSITARGWMTVEYRKGILYTTVYVYTHTDANLRVQVWGFHLLPIKRAAKVDLRATRAHKQHNIFVAFIHSKKGIYQVSY